MPCPKLAEIEPSALSMMESHVLPGPLRMMDTVPVPVGTSRFMPAAAPNCAPSTSDASSRISTCVPSGLRSKRRLDWILPPKAVASEMSKTARPFLTWAVAATSASWVAPAVACAADSLRSRLKRLAKFASISSGTWPFDEPIGVKAERNDLRSSVSNANVPESTGRASANVRSSAPTPGFLSSASLVPVNLTRPVSPLTLLVTETAPMVPANAGLAPSHSSARLSDGVLNCACPSKKAFWARPALPSNEKFAGAALKDAETADVPPARSSSGAAEDISTLMLSPRQMPVAERLASALSADQLAWPFRPVRISTSLPSAEPITRPSRTSSAPKGSEGSLPTSGFVGLALTMERAVSTERAMRPPVGMGSVKSPLGRRSRRKVGLMKCVAWNTTSPRSAASADRSISTRSACSTGGASVSVHFDSFTSVRMARNLGQTSICGVPSIATRKPLQALISQAMRSRTIRVDAI